MAELALHDPERVLDLGPHHRDHPVDPFVEALIAAVYLAGTNTRRVKRALFGLFEGAVSKDVVSRAWRKVKVNWDAWSARSLAEEDIVRLILPVNKTRLDRKAGDRLFTFTRLDPSQWKSARTTNAPFGRFALQIACRAMIERLNGEFRPRIKTQTVLPCAETVPMLLWALLASGQIQMRKVDGWETLSQPLEPVPLDLAA